MNRSFAIGLAILGLFATVSPAAIYNVTVDGPDAIFLAGRTDIVIPPASDPWTGPAGSYLIRHGGATPEEALEQVPSFIPVSGGDVIRVLDPAVGAINFFNGFGGGFGPAGNGSSGSSLSSLAGISGYIGPQGPLTGVFLDDLIPNLGPAPETLDFADWALGTNFSTLSPLLGQVFYIGDGVDSLNNFQTFIAPAGATRLFFGIPDGFGFIGAPGAYDDNDGSYRVTVGVNQLPTEPAIPAPAALPAGLALLAFSSLRRRAGTKG